MPGLSETEARGRFYLVDRQGLLVEGMTDLQPFQAPFAQSRDRVAGWTLESPGRIGLADVVANAQPTVLIGTSGQAGRVLAKPSCAAWPNTCARPVIFPLSNPTERAEATPQDLDAWTEGRAVIGTGSPFPPLKRNGKRLSRRPDQQRLCLSRHRARRDRRRRAPHFRWHVPCRRADDRRVLAGQARPGRQPPAAARRNSQALVPCRACRRQTGAGRRISRIPCPTRHLAAAVRAKMWEPLYARYRRLPRA